MSAPPPLYLDFALRVGIKEPGGSTRRDPMALHVNLDALIPREDFETISKGAEAPLTQNVKISELEKTAFFYGALRKPDFQRETAEWDPQRTVGLIRTFIEDDLIPSVILWRNRELLFVIDGSHRLSALIAWVQDDYGDGQQSQEFFEYTIPEEQLKTAQRTRALVEKEFGSYLSHKEAIANPSSYGPDIVSRARRFGSLSLQLQWVTGDAARAQESFVRINQQAAIITPQELELLKNRRKPATIAARAILRRGTGHQYWSIFAELEQQKIREVATDLHKLIFEPTLRYPIKSLDLPIGGPVYSATALRMVYDFISLAVDVVSQEDDTRGQRTIEYLNRARRVMHLICGNHASSIGVHPAIYCYSWTGKQQPILFLAIASVIIDFERTKKLDEFIKIRAALEMFLLEHRALLNQIIRKFGTKASGAKHLRSFYNKVIAELRAGVPTENLVDRLREDHTYSYLQAEESPYEGVSPTKFSTQVKSGFLMGQLLLSAPRCKICNGFVPSQSVSTDHVIRAEDGGSSAVDNAQLTHPYCNTGYKERLHHAAVRADRIS
jgi:hypothetical protein